MARPLHLAWALALGACFTGGFLAGQPCMSDADCGPSLRCTDGVCGGATAGPEPTTTTTTTGEPTTTTTTIPPTTDTSGTSTGAPTTSTTEPATTEPAASTSTEGPTTTSEGSTTGGGCGLGRCKDIDMLLVIDNSPSMNGKGPILLSAMLAFSEVVTASLQQACSLHFGVITTDAYQQNPTGCRKLGALVRANSDGEPCNFTEGLPYATLPDLETPINLSCMFSVGAGGSGDEKPFDALFASFKPEQNVDCNAGFHRPGAILLVLLATDEDDDDKDAQGNSGSDDLLPSLWQSTLSALKNGGDDLYVLGLLGDEDPNTTACPWDPLAGPDGTGAESAPILRKFIQSFPEDRHTIDSLCRMPDPAEFTAMAKEIQNELVAACAE